MFNIIQYGQKNHADRVQYQNVVSAKGYRMPQHSVDGKGSVPFAWDYPNVVLTHHKYQKILYHQSYLFDKPRTVTKRQNQGNTEFHAK